MDLTNVTKNVIGVALTTMLFSCSGSGGDGGGTTGGTTGNTGTTTEITIPDDAETNPLARSLIRVSGDAASAAGVWVCFNKQYLFSIIALTDFGGGQTAFSHVTPTSMEDANIHYSYSVTSKNSVDLFNQNGGLYESLTYITFSTERALSMSSSLRGELSCVYLTTAEFNAVNLGESSIADITRNDPMLPIPKPDGLIEYMSFIEPASLGNFSSFDSVALFEGGVVPGNSGDFFGINGKPDLESPRYTWQVSVETLSLGTNDYMILPTTPAQPDEKLNACVWFVISEPNFIPGANFNERRGRNCYFPDGRFTVQQGYDVADMLSKPFVATPFNNGRYRVDSHTIRFLYDSGFQENDPIAWRNVNEREAFISGQTFLSLKGPASLTGLSN